MKDHYIKMYPRASKFLEEVSKESILGELLLKLSDTDWDTIRDALADFAVEVLNEQNHTNGAAK